VNAIFEWLSAALEAHTGVALAAAFAWGVASIALSPCHLASVPLAVAFLRRDARSGALRISLALAAGVLASLVVIGVVTVAAGRIAGDLWGAGPWIAATALLLAGLYLLGVLQIPTSFTIDQDRIPRNARGALLVGLFLGVTLGPCTFAFFAPVFATAFSSAESHVALSSGLVAAFAAGHTLAIALAGLFGLKLSTWLSRGGTFSARLRAAAGVLLLASAIYVIATIP